MTRTGLLEGQLGMDAALARVEDSGWARRALDAIDAFTRADVSFTAEDVRARAGDPASPNAMGALMRLAVAYGLIEVAGTRRSTRPDARGRQLPVWRRKP